MAITMTSPRFAPTRRASRPRVLLKVVAALGVIIGAYAVGRRGAERACRRQVEAMTPSIASQVFTPPFAVPEGLPEDTVSASRIIDDYRTNEIMARRAHNGHPFHVVGTIVGVRNIFGSPVLVLAGADLLGRPSTLFTLNAFLPKDELELAARLLPGDNVLLQCRESAKLGVPYLSGCVFVSEEPASKAG